MKHTLTILTQFDNNFVWKRENLTSYDRATESATSQSLEIQPTQTIPPVPDDLEIQATFKNFPKTELFGTQTPSTKYIIVTIYKNKKKLRGTPQKLIQSQVSLTIEEAQKLMKKRNINLQQLVNTLGGLAVEKLDKPKISQTPEYAD